MARLIRTKRGPRCQRNDGKFTSMSVCKRAGLKGLGASSTRRRSRRSLRGVRGVRGVRGLRGTRRCRDARGRFKRCR